jgi:type I restriction enzyme, S subunit
MADEYVDDGVPFLRSQNIRPFRIATENLKFINPAFHDRLRKSALQPGDVVIVRTGYPGTAAVIPPWLSDANCADLVVISPGPGLDAHYLVAIFNSNWGITSVAGNLVGSAQQHFNVGAARRLRIHVPPVAVQKKISGVLAAYNDLIENNFRRIQVLDEMGGRIYREWFVDLRYPGHETVPLVDSEFGPVPEGWGFESLGALARVDKGLSYKGSYLTVDGVPMANLKCFDVGGGFRRDGTKPYSGPFKAGHAVTPGTVIVANTDLTQVGNVIGSPAIIPARDFSDGGLISHHLFAVRPRDERLGTGFLFHSLRDLRFRQFARSRASGTTVLGLRTRDCEQYEVLLPPTRLRERFEAMANNMQAQIEGLEDAVADLRATRDLLLPRVVDGRIDVTDLDIAMPEVAA